MTILFVILGLFLLCGACTYYLPIRSEKVEGTNLKKPDWYEYGPWQIGSDGTHVCVQKAEGSPKRAIIGWNEKDWKDYIKFDPWWLTMSGYREPTLDDIPLLKRYCAHLNQTEYEKAKVAGWAEMGGEV